MYRVEREIHFCYGHRVSNYDGKCRHLHGHNARAVIILEAPSVGPSGMVMDFRQIKINLGQWIDDELDHRMLLWEGDPLVKLLRDTGEPIVTMTAQPTAENIARLIYDKAQERGLPVVEVRLWETPTACAVYQG